MYLRQILHNCVALEVETGSLYDDLAELHRGNDELTGFLRGLASDERFHARVLTALAAIIEVDSDDGPFLVTVQAALDRERAKLEALRQKICEGPGELEARQITAAIEPTELLTVYPELFAMVQKRMRGFSRLLDRPDETMGHGDRPDKPPWSNEKAVEKTGRDKAPSSGASKSDQKAPARAS